ncbi:MAG: carbohydrate binding domain-containing protein [Phycisphaerae bacterium]|nr:carbohydrate binding domain-containing protein [Phycisphaerae bacterium]
MDRIRVVLLILLTAILAEAYQVQAFAEFPEDVIPVWDMDKAWQEATPTRERIAINGLWRWQPANAKDTQIPEDGWSYFKVPGCWPGITDYMQKDCQVVYAPEKGQDVKVADITAAWYQREITVPAGWSGQSITVSTKYLNSYAVVYLDGELMGEMRFPAGEVDLTRACRPGRKQNLSMLVIALPLQAVMRSYHDTNVAREVKGSVARRGLCGDVYLAADPVGARLGDIEVETSVRKWQIRFDCAVLNLPIKTEYSLRARIDAEGKHVCEFTSKPFGAMDVSSGRMAFTANWRPDQLWDIDTPQSRYNVSVSLLDASGRVLDTALPVPFGFREFWIDGRDFFLNGTQIFLSAVPFDNAQVGAAWATYNGAKESLRRLQSFGINFVYTHNYGCEPGAHLSFEEILRAADDVGMLVALSQPHFSHYAWTAADADSTNGYAKHAEFYVRVAQNHPSVVMYAMSHNATGYSEDMNPDLIDGIHAPRSEWSERNARQALRAEAIVRRLDPTRIVYHHAGGNIGAMHTSNFYPNWVPIQEMSDWFEHWATEGVKPFFACEYGAPFTWDWAMYRGWYKSNRTFGSAVVPWDFCLAEWNAQFFGDQAFQISDQEKTNLRWEAAQFRKGKLWHRWDYPHQLGSRDFDERYPVLAAYLTDNWRAFRTWGVSAISPWEHGVFWKMRPGLDRNRRMELKTDWQNLQRPGFSPDYIEERYERMDLAYEAADWVATPAADALYRNNGSLLAYIAGKPASFTSKDHNFLPGETVEKQFIVINNARDMVTAECDWSFDLPKSVAGSRQVTVTTGNQERVPLHFSLPADLQPGAYTLNATFTFSTGEVQQDRFIIDVLPAPTAAGAAAKIALFDPKGETRQFLAAMGVHCQLISVGADLSGTDVLIIGKAALTAEGPGPDLRRVRDGLKVIVFEQTSEALEKRLGFRVQEYGLRNVFSRVPDHPYLTGLDDKHLQDWRGGSTILPPKLQYETSSKYNEVPAVRWCGLEVPRLWRCGNRGSVASVLIEKPSIGDFLPIVDGGFSLQYSPLLEYREGKGMVLFCQMDVTGRTEQDPAAARLVRNILSYVCRTSYPVCPDRKALYVGDPVGRRHLERAAILASPCQGDDLSPNDVLVVGPQGGRTLAPHKSALARWLNAGGRMLAIQLDADEANAFLPKAIRTTMREHIAACFNPPDLDSPFAGVGPADVHNRDPQEIPFVSAGAESIANGVLAQANGGAIVFCQLAPYNFTGSAEQQNLTKTFRRSAFLLTRILANMGVRGETPLLSRFATPASGAPKPSVVKNGDFHLNADNDGMPDHWQFSSSFKQAACKPEPGPNETAGPSLRITCPKPGPGEKGDVMLSQSNVAVEAGQWYRISLWAKATDMAEARIALALQDTTAWRGLFDYQYFVPHEEWKEFVFLVQANAAASKTRFQIWHSNPSTLWLCDIRMTPCESPSQGRWLSGLYMDVPQEWDDPYRFFRW